MKKMLTNLAIGIGLAIPSIALAQKAEQDILPSCDPEKKYETVQEAMNMLGVRRIESLRFLRGGYVTSDRLNTPLNRLVQYTLRADGADPEKDRYAGLPAAQSRVYNKTDDNRDCVITEDELKAEYELVRKEGTQ